MPRKPNKSTSNRNREGIRLEYEAVTHYLNHLRQLQSGARLRNLRGQFISDAVGMGEVFVRIVQSKILGSQGELAELADGTLTWKRATLGKNELYMTKLVKGNPGRYVEEKLLHTGFYYDSIGFTNSLLNVKNRNQKLQASGGKYVPGDRKNIVNAKKLGYSKGVVTLDIGLVNANEKVYQSGNGKRWSLEQIAAFHEFGTLYEPARPVWGPAIEEFNGYMSGPFLERTFRKTYQLCEDLILGTAAERRDRSGRVKATSFATSGSFTKALYNATFEGIHNPQKTNAERMASGQEYDGSRWQRIGE